MHVPGQGAAQAWHQVSMQRMTASPDGSGGWCPSPGKEELCLRIWRLPSKELFEDVKTASLPFYDEHQLLKA